MNYYIFIRGPLGSGKSTISEKLAQKLDAQYIRMDEVLEKNGLDTISPDISCIPAENFIKANELIIPSVKEKLLNGKIVIFDACFYHKDALEHLIQNLEFAHYIFTLKVPLKICIKRDDGRIKKYGEEATQEVFDLVSRFDYGININASGSLSETINAILSYLPQP